MERERHVVIPAEGRDLRHDIVGPARSHAAEAHLFQRIQHIVPALPVKIAQFLIVRFRERERLGAGLLQRRGRPDRQKVVHLADAGGQCRGRQNEADAPAGHAEGFGNAVDGDRPLGHARQGPQRNIFGAVVKDMLIDLVGDRQHVVFLAQLGNQFEILPGKDPAGGVVGRIDHDRPGFFVESRRQFLGTEREIGRMQTDKPGRGAAEDGVRPVVFIERFKNDDFLARIDGRHQRGDHPFRRSATDSQVRFRIEGHAIIPLRLRDDCIPQILSAPGDGVLVVVVHDRPAGGVFDFGRRRKIRETLGQIHGLVFGGDPRHFPDHRFGKLRRFVGYELSHCVWPPCFAGFSVGLGAGGG